MVVSARSARSHLGDLAVTLRAQVPEHELLSSRFDPDDRRRLVRSTRIRAIAWTLPAGIALAIAAPVSG